jgi:hypothetical protein
MTVTFKEISFWEATSLTSEALQVLQSSLTSISEFHFAAIHNWLCNIIFSCRANRVNIHISMKYLFSSQLNFDKDIITLGLRWRKEFHENYFGCSCETKIKLRAYRDLWFYFAFVVRFLSTRSLNFRMKFLTYLITQRALQQRKHWTWTSREVESCLRDAYLWIRHSS